MPEIGEKKTGWELGRMANSPCYVWAACLSCGKERWVIIHKGEPEFRYCRSCSHANNKQERVKYLHRGYLKIPLDSNDPFYPMATQKGYILEHRLIVAHHLDRCLQSWEVVHHKNGNKSDNRIENLELFSNNHEHDTITAMEVKIHGLKNTIKEKDEIIIKLLHMVESLKS